MGPFTADGAADGGFGSFVQDVCVCVLYVVMRTEKLCMLCACQATWASRETVRLTVPRTAYGCGNRFACLRPSFDYGATRRTSRSERKVRHSSRLKRSSAGLAPDLIVAGSFRARAACAFSRAVRLSTLRLTGPGRVVCEAPMPPPSVIAPLPRRWPENCFCGGWGAHHEISNTHQHKFAGPDQHTRRHTTGRAAGL